ncbi:MAG: hypothetical protein ACTSWX_00855 [Promethearchaeota archaeon]
MNTQLNLNNYIRNRCPMCQIDKSLSDVRCLECGESLEISLDSSSFNSFLTNFISTWQYQNLELNKSGMIDDLFIESSELYGFILYSVFDYIYNYLLDIFFQDIEYQINESFNFHPDLHDSLISISKNFSKKMDIINNLQLNLKRPVNPFKKILENYTTAFQQFKILKKKLKKKTIRLKFLKFFNKKIELNSYDFLTDSKNKLQDLLKEYYNLYKILSKSNQLIPNYERFKLNLDKMHKTQIPAELLHIEIEYKALFYALNKLTRFNLAQVPKRTKKNLESKILIKNYGGDL